MTGILSVTPTRMRPWTRCLVCYHTWHLTDPDVKPRECPQCGTMLWAAMRWRKTAVPKQRALPAGTVWLVCARCGWQWFVRSGVLPVRCANQTCSSPYWHRARRQRREGGMTGQRAGANPPPAQPVEATSPATA